MISYTDGVYNATFDKYGSLIKFAPATERWVSHGGPLFGGKEATRIIAELRLPKTQVRKNIAVNAVKNNTVQCGFTEYQSNVMQEIADSENLTIDDLLQEIPNTKKGEQNGN